MRVLANLSIGWKIFCVLSVLFVLVAGVSTSLISVLRQTDAQYSSLLSDDAVVIVEQMRLRGDLIDYARVMGVILQLQHPPEGLAEQESNLAGLSVAISHSLDVIAAVHAATARSEATKAALPKIYQAAAAAIAIKRSGAADEGGTARDAWLGSNGQQLVLAITEQVSQAADQRLANIKAHTTEYHARADSTVTTSITNTSAIRSGTSEISQAADEGLRVLAGNTQRKPMADEQEWQEF